MTSVSMPATVVDLAAHRSQRDAAQAAESEGRRLHEQLLAEAAAWVAAQYGPVM